jgi:hypothetical protein
VVNTISVLTKSRKSVLVIWAVFLIGLLGTVFVSTNSPAPVSLLSAAGSPASVTALVSKDAPIATLAPTVSADVAVEGEDGAQVEVPAQAEAADAADNPPKPKPVADTLSQPSFGGVGPDGDENSPLFKFETASGSTSAPVGLLPAYRWGSSASLVGDIATFDFLATTGTIIASIGMGFAGLMWTVLLNIMNVALTMTLVTTLAETINDVFLDLANSLLTSGIVVIIGAVALFMAAKSLLKGKLTRVISIGVLFVVPVAILQLVTTAASGATTNSAIPKWSPAWVAVSGSNLVNELGGGVITSLSARVGAIADPNGEYFTVEPTNPDTTNSVDCTQYIGVLNARYEQYQQGSVSKDGESIINGSEGAAGRHAMLLISTGWVDSFLYPFAEAQYGNADMGMDMVCKQMEIQRGTSFEEMYSIVGGTVAGNKRAAPTLGPFAGWGPRPFKTYTRNIVKEGAAQIMVWDACSDERGTAVSSGWNVLRKVRLDGSAATPAAGAVGAVEDGGVDFSNGTGIGWLADVVTDVGGNIIGGVSNTLNVENLKDEGVEDAQCVQWSRQNFVTGAEWLGFGGGVVESTDPAGKDVGTLLFTEAILGNTLMPGELNELPGLMAVPDGTNKVDAENLQQVGRVWESYVGQNPGQRTVSGLLMPLSAGLRLWSFGIMALGVIISQVALVLLLALLPVSLILAAIPTEDRSSNVGFRMLKLTGAMLLTKLVMTAALTLLVVLTAVISTAGMGLLPGSQTFMVSLAPVLAFFVLRWILKKAGLGNITSAGGAVGAVKGAAINATGDSKMAEGARSLDGKGGPGVAAGKARGMAAAKRQRSKNFKDMQRAMGNAPDGSGKNGDKGALAADIERKKRRERIANSESDSGKAVAGVKKGGRFGGLLNFINAGNPNRNLKEELGADGATEGKVSGTKTIKEMFRNARNGKDARNSIVSPGMNPYLDSLEKGVLLAGGVKYAQKDAELKREQAAREAGAGVNKDDYLTDSLPLASLLNPGSGTGGIDLVESDSGEINPAATRAKVSVASVLPPDVLDTVSDLARQKFEDHGSAFSYEDCYRASMQAVTFDLGLSTATGQQIDVVAAAGMSDVEWSDALKVMQNGGPPPEAFTNLARELGARVQADRETWAKEMAQAADRVLSSVSIVPMAGPYSLKVALRAPINNYEEFFDDLGDFAKEIDKSVGAQRAQAIERVQQALQSHVSGLSSSMRSFSAAELSIDVSNARLDGLDETPIVIRSEEALKEISSWSRGLQASVSNIGGQVNSGQSAGAVLSQLQAEVEVSMSNIFAREDMRQKQVTEVMNKLQAIQPKTRDTGRNEWR